jgi:acyl-CoA dehydrogenase
LHQERLNCSAPDTGNMEVLERVGTPAQKEQWLKPLLEWRDPLRLRHDRAGPGRRSDAQATSRTQRRPGRMASGFINGEKYYASGAGDPRCKIMIVHGENQ